MTIKNKGLQQTTLKMRYTTVQIKQFPWKRFFALYV